MYEKQKTRCIFRCCGTSNSKSIKYTTPMNNMQQPPTTAPPPPPFQQQKPLQLRLHLVRHGETIANLQNNVIGQSDSPLTELGKQQGIALRKWLLSNNGTNDTSSSSSSTTFVSSVPSDDSLFFWRIYSSDLGRTKHTTQLLLLQEYNDNNDQLSSHSSSTGNHHHSDATTTPPTPCRNDNNVVRYDHRLREIARGLRQGLPKEYTYDVATSIYTSGQHPLYSRRSSSDDDGPVPVTKLPIRETDDDGWNRMYTSWFMELIQDIAKHHVDTTMIIDNNNNNKNDPCCFNVLVVTHAALLRVFLTRILGGYETLQQHKEVVYKYDNNDTGVPMNNRLHIPNTSVTILNITLAVHTTTTTTNDTNNPTIQNIEIERFTSTDHYEYISSSSSSVVVSE